MKLILKTMCGCRKIIDSKITQRYLPDKIDVPLYKTVSDYCANKKNTRTFYLTKNDEIMAIYYEYPDTEDLGDWEPDDNPVV